MSGARESLENKDRNSKGASTSIRDGKLNIYSYSMDMSFRSLMSQDSSSEPSSFNYNLRGKL
jgi:hypothetical protein